MFNQWDSPAWSRQAVFYQIFPDRFFDGDPRNNPEGTVSWDSIPTREDFFGGDLQGIRAKLDYLQALGITALYTTPFFKARTNHRYDTSDYLQIDPVAGTLDDFKALVAGLKQRDMRLVLDAVFNHCGDGFWAFQDVCERGRASDYIDWFRVEQLPVVETPASYQTCGGAPFLPKLNTTNPAVRDYLMQVTRYWLEQGADGWRLDVPWKVPMDFWREFKLVALAANPQAYLVAEVWRGTDAWLHGDTVHGIMNYRLRSYILDYCVYDHMDAEDFDYEVTALRVEHGASAYSHLTLLGSHDTPRLLTLCGGNAQRAFLSVVFQMTYIGIPMIYYGDEVGMTGENDPLCRAGMIWDWSAQNQQFQETYRMLIHLRRNHPELVEGDFETLYTFNGVYAFRRFLGNQSIIVVMNPREQRHNVRIPSSGAADTAAAWRDQLTGKMHTSEEGYIILDELPSCSALILLPAGDS